MYYVYQILDKKGNLLYIGKGKDEGKYSRLEYYKYLSQDRYIDRKLKKIKKFDIEIVKEFVQEKDALVYEQFLIKNKNPLCNLTTGGEGVSGYKHTSVSKEKMSKSRNIDVSLVNLKKAVEANKGKRKLDEYKKSEIIEQVEENGWVKGAKRLKVSFPTLKTYCRENHIEIHSNIQKQNSRNNIKKAMEKRWII